MRWDKNKKQINKTQCYTHSQHTYPYPTVSVPSYDLYHCNFSKKQINQSIKHCFFLFTFLRFGAPAGAGSPTTTALSQQSITTLSFPPGLEHLPVPAAPQRPPCLSKEHLQIADESELRGETSSVAAAAAIYNFQVVFSAAVVCACWTANIVPRLRVGNIFIWTRNTGPGILCFIFLNSLLPQLVLLIWEFFFQYFYFILVLAPLFSF